MKYLNYISKNSASLGRNAILNEIYDLFYKEIYMTYVKMAHFFKIYILQ